MYKVVSFNLCPYVQRSIFVLNELEIPHQITYIDLRNKPDWFLEMSPTGKVPVLETPEGHVIFESAVINEYLDEVHGPRFLPAAPLERARARMWHEFMGALYGDVYRLYATPEQEQARASLEAIRSRLQRAEESVQGSYFQGEEPSLADVAAAPAFMRLTWVERIDPALSAFTGLPAVTAWRDALLARPAVQQSVLPEIETVFLESLRKNNAWLASRLVEQKAGGPATPSER